MTDPRLADPDTETRLGALRELVGATTRPAPRGINCHVHTNYSFASFRSPAEAAWLAFDHGVEIFGINDHYTVDGHDEFGRACAVAGLPALFSIEIVAMDRQAEADGVLLNDPGNPGRVYLCGKGVTDAGNAEAAATLAELRRHQEARNRAMVQALDARFQEALGEAGPSWNAIADQTPLGNTTERHIAKAAVAHLAAGDEPEARFERLCGAAPTGDDAARQNQLRSCLLKAGRPCYVAEDPAAYPDVASVRELFLQLGAIPTYPVLGNPVTPGEADIAALCDRLAVWGFHSLELITSRNSDDRVAAVLAEAERRRWPVVDGTEHNTAAMVPLINELGSDPRFLPQLRAGALVLLGHQARIAAGQPGYLDRSGQVVDGAYDACLSAGEAALGAISN